MGVRYLNPPPGIMGEKLFRKVIQMRDDREFTALAEQYMDMVYRVALNAVRCPADAEDVTQDVMTGKKHMDQLALDGCWEFSFTVLLTGEKTKVVVPDFTAVYNPIFEYDKERGKTVDVKNISITTGEIYLEYNEEEYTGPLPRVLLKNGGEVGSSGGHGKELDGGRFAWEYRWVMPVDTSQIAALQLGETVVKIG